MPFSSLASVKFAVPCVPSFCLKPIPSISSFVPFKKCLIFIKLNTPIVTANIAINIIPGLQRIILGALNMFYAPFKIIISKHFSSVLKYNVTITVNTSIKTHINMTFLLLSSSLIFHCFKLYSFQKIAFIYTNNPTIFWS